MIRVHEVRPTHGHHMQEGEEVIERWINPDDITGVHLQNGSLSLEFLEGSGKTHMLPIRENFTELSRLIMEYRHGGT